MTRDDETRAEPGTVKMLVLTTIRSWNVSMQLNIYEAMFTDSWSGHERRMENTRAGCGGRVPTF